MEKTFCIIKPDCVIRRACGAEILDHFLNIFKLKFFQQIKLSKQFLTNFYSHHKDKPFFKDLIDFMRISKCIVFVLEGEDSSKILRNIIGPTLPEKAEIEKPNSIRAKYGIIGSVNAVHVSESYKDGKKEIDLFSKFFEYKENGIEEAKDYLERYLNFPLVPSFQYRNLIKDFKEGKIEEKSLKEKIVEMLEYETDFKRSVLKKFSFILIKQALRD